MIMSDCKISENSIISRVCDTILGFVFTMGTYINFTMMRYMLSGRVKTDIDKLIICEQAMNLIRCV